jgi:hypothetical protein
LRFRGTIALLLAASVAGPACRALAADGSHHPVNLSFLYPISTNKNPDVSTAFQLAILEGRIGSLQGLGLNGGVSLIGRDFRGVQITGFYAQVDGAVRGLDLTGGVNYNRSEAHGVLIAGASNLTRGEASGLMIGGLFNVAGRSFHGVQVATGFNFIEDEGGFLQIGGVANTVGGTYRGAQLGFGYNIAAGDFRGVQVSGVNLALDKHGAQIGLLNVARDSYGLQVGIVNRVREQHGIPVGMVNVETNGSVEGLAYWSNVTGANLGVRTTVRRWYSMLTAAAPDEYEGDSPHTLSLNWNYGYEVVSGERWHVGLDLGYSHYIPWDVDDAPENVDLHFAFQARGLVDVRLSKNISAFAGGGSAWIYPSYSLGDPAASEGLYFGGLALR